MSNIQEKAVFTTADLDDFLGRCTLEQRVYIYEKIFPEVGKIVKRDFNQIHPRSPQRTSITPIKHTVHTSVRKPVGLCGSKIEAINLSKSSISPLPYRRNEGKRAEGVNYQQSSPKSSSALARQKDSVARLHNSRYSRSAMKSIPSLSITQHSSSSSQRGQLYQYQRQSVTPLNQSLSSISDRSKPRWNDTQKLPLRQPKKDHKDLDSIEISNIQIKPHSSTLSHTQQLKFKTSRKQAKVSDRLSQPKFQHLLNQTKETPMRYTIDNNHTIKVEKDDLKVVESPQKQSRNETSPAKSVNFSPYVKVKTQTKFDEEGTNSVEKLKGTTDDSKPVSKNESSPKKVETMKIQENKPEPQSAKKSEAVKEEQKKPQPAVKEQAKSQQQDTKQASPNKQASQKTESTKIEVSKEKTVTATQQPPVISASEENDGPAFESQSTLKVNVTSKITESKTAVQTEEVKQRKDTTASTSLLQNALVSQKSLTTSDQSAAMTQTAKSPEKVNENQSPSKNLLGSSTRADTDFSQTLAPNKSPSLNKTAKSSPAQDMAQSQKFDAPILEGVTKKKSADAQQNDDEALGKSVDFHLTEVQSSTVMSVSQTNESGNDFNDRDSTIEGDNESTQVVEEESKESSSQSSKNKKKNKKKGRK